MLVQPYDQLSDLALLELCVWREARGEPHEGKAAVAQVIRNRVYFGPKWMGGDWRNVILKPWQFSSFNESDPNSKLWPGDNDPSFVDTCQSATPVYLGQAEDATLGALFYHDTSMGWPAAWGSQAGYVQTLAVGRLLFYKPIPANNQGAVIEAAEGEN